MKLILALFLLIGLGVQAQYSSKQLDSLMQDALKKFNVAGAALAVVKDGKIIHQQGYGVSSVNTNAAVTAETNFDIASNSKAFTTAAITILAEQGKLSWQDPVVKYIPEFKLYDEYVTAHFTIEDLVTHRSGLALGVGDLMFVFNGSNFTINDYLTNLQYFEPVSPFRTKFDYDNSLYIVAGEVIARVSGVSYPEFIKKNILLPLGMVKSYVGTQYETPTNLADPHSTISGKMEVVPHMNMDLGAAAGGIFSSVSDLSKWVMMHLNHGKYSEGKQLFTPQSQNNMWRLHTVKDNPTSSRYSTHFRGYGLGWDLMDVNGKLKVSHTGGLTGMLSMVTMYPDLNLGIIVLTNTESGGAGLFTAVSNTIADAYLGMDNFHWTEKMVNAMAAGKSESDAEKKAVWDQVEKVKKTKIDLTKFAGTYEDPWFGPCEITLKDNQLWFQSKRAPHLKGRMYFYNANTFAILWDDRVMNCDAFALFTLDEKGVAQSIQMKGIASDIDFSYDFHDLRLKRVK